MSRRLSSYDIWQTVWDSDEWIEEERLQRNVVVFTNGDRRVIINTGREGRVVHAWRRYGDGPTFSWIGPTIPNKAAIVVHWLTKPWPRREEDD